MLNIIWNALTLQHFDIWFLIHPTFVFDWSFCYWLYLIHKSDTEVFLVPLGVEPRTLEPESKNLTTGPCYYAYLYFVCSCYLFSTTAVYYSVYFCLLLTWILLQVSLNEIFIIILELNHTAQLIQLDRESTYAHNINSIVLQWCCIILYRRSFFWNF